MGLSKELERVLSQVKPLAREYYKLTNRPIGITGEIAEYEAARLLDDVELAPVRQQGYDAVRRSARGVQLLQIKGRRLLPTSKPGQRLGAVQLGKKWDAVLLVLLDQEYEATAIYEADRPSITAALTAPGSKARNERGQLGVSKFRSIGHIIWPPG
jgi:hypothetical protein